MTEKARFYLRSTARIGQLLAGLGMYSAVACAQTPPPTETGIWLDDSAAGAIEIYICADRADRLCGRIVWLKEPLNAQGVPKRDRYNPNEALQTRPICGLPVLGNLAKVQEGGFDGGWIYDPKAGKSYSAAIELARQDRLTVTGYVGMKFLSKSFTWTRAPADIQRCDSAAAAQGIKAGKAMPAQPKPPTSASATQKAPAPPGQSAAIAPASPPPEPKPAAVPQATASPAVKPPSPAAKPPVTATTATVPAPKPATPKTAATGTTAKVSPTAATSTAKATAATKPITATASKPTAAGTAAAKSASSATATAAAGTQPARPPAAASRPTTTADETSDDDPIPAPFSWGGN